MPVKAWWFDSTRGHPKSIFPTMHQGRLAQLVRAAALHAVGLGFESLIAHFSYYLHWLNKSLYCILLIVDL